MLPPRLPPCKLQPSVGHDEHDDDDGDDDDDGGHDDGQVNRDGGDDDGDDDQEGGLDDDKGGGDGGDDYGDICERCEVSPKVSSGRCGKPICNCQVCNLEHDSFCIGYCRFVFALALSHKYKTVVSKHQFGEKCSPGPLAKCIMPHTQLTTTRS